LFPSPPLFRAQPITHTRTHAHTHTHTHTHTHAHTHPHTRTHTHTHGHTHAHTHAAETLRSLCHCVCVCVMRVCDARLSSAPLMQKIVVFPAASCCREGGAAGCLSRPVTLNLQTPPALRARHTHTQTHKHTHTHTHTLSLSLSLPLSLPLCIAILLSFSKSISIHLLDSSISASMPWECLLTISSPSPHRCPVGFHAGRVNFARQSHSVSRGQKC